MTGLRRTEDYLSQGPAKQSSRLCGPQGSLKLMLFFVFLHKDSKIEKQFSIERLPEPGPQVAGIKLDDLTLPWPLH